MRSELLRAVLPRSAFLKGNRLSIFPNAVLRVRQLRNLLAAYLVRYNRRTKTDLLFFCDPKSILRRTIGIARLVPSIYCANNLLNLRAFGMEVFSLI